MAKKKKAKRRVPMSPEKRAKFVAVWSNSEYIENTAMEMWRAGKIVSITNLYHAIKGPLGLPGHYDFDYGDALKEVLKEAGWIRPEGGGGGVLDWSPE
jgi:hypothetical protein